MNEAEKELTALRLWKEDALEALAAHREQEERHIAMIGEMHDVIGMVADALHQSQLALNKYVEVKNDFFAAKKKRGTKVPNV
jgi:hypothetical protein